MERGVEEEEQRDEREEWGRGQREDIGAGAGAEALAGAGTGGDLPWDGSEEDKPSAKKLKRDFSGNSSGSLVYSRD